MTQVSTNRGIEPPGPPGPNQARPAFEDGAAAGGPGRPSLAGHRTGPVDEPTRYPGDPDE